MHLDPSALTFDADFALQESDHVASIPVDITTLDELCAAIQRQLAVPAYFTSGNWDNLFDCLCHPYIGPAPGVYRAGRTVLLHQDIPLLMPDRFHAAHYLRIVIESILLLQQYAQKQGLPDAEGPREELVAVFPPSVRDAIDQLLSEPIPVWWEIEMGVYLDAPHSLLRLRAPEWSVVEQGINHLDGITLDYLSVSKGDACFFSVRSIRQRDGYYINYSALPEVFPNEIWLSSPLEQERLTLLLSKAEVMQRVKAIYEQEHLPQTYPWYLLSLEENAFEEVARIWHYADAEEVFGEVPEENVRWEIYTGMQEMQEEEHALYTVNDWQEVLTHPETDENAEQRLTALCVQSRINVSDISDQLLRSLSRPRIDERWVSARFLGLAHDERAVPVLCQMLTEAWDLHVQHKQETMWYFSWRRYAPRLLRFWQTQPVLDALFQALQVWLAADPQFDPRYDYWIEYEANLCYELGYRDAFDLVLALPLQAQHHTFLPISLAKGYFTRSRHIGFLEETHNRIHSYSHIRAIAPEMLEILEVKCHLSRQQAQELFDAFLDEKNPISSYF